MVLRRIFGPKRNEVAGDWRRLHNNELYALYYSSNIIPVIKLRKQVGRACSTYGSEVRYIQGFWWGNLREGDHLEDSGVRWEDNIKVDSKEEG
jgi:hypothetical protein